MGVSVGGSPSGGTIPLIVYTLGTGGGGSILCYLCVC